MRWKGMLLLGVCGVSPAVAAESAWQGSAVDALSQRAHLARDWVDPVLGIRLGWVLAERHAMTVWMMGSDSDDVTVDAMASYGYRVTQHAWLRVGYRDMTLRQVGRRFDVDIAVSGPGIGLEARF